MKCLWIEFSLNQMRLTIVHLIALVDGENMVGELEIEAVQVAEAMHLTSVPSRRNVMLIEKDE